MLHGALGWPAMASVIDMYLFWDSRKKSFSPSLQGPRKVKLTLLVTVSYSLNVTGCCAVQLLL